MVIRVWEGERRITVPCPLSLARLMVALTPQSSFDRRVSRSLRRAPKDERAQAEAVLARTPLDKGGLLELLTAVSEVAREFKGLKIVEVESGDGERVEITL